MNINKKLSKLTQIMLYDRFNSGTEEVILLSDVERIIKNIYIKAFKDGENWGVTYSTWFNPSKEDTEKRIKEYAKKIGIEL